jgi:hypothetical protein
MPATRPWSTDFLLQEGLSQAEIGKIDEEQAHAMAETKKIAPGNDFYISLWTSTAIEIQCRRTAACMLCEKIHQERGSSWKGKLPKEKIGHIQSAGCLGQWEVVIAAHNACTRELLQEVKVHGEADRHMRLL